MTDDDTPSDDDTDAQPDLEDDDYVEVDPDMAAEVAAEDQADDVDDDQEATDDVDEESTPSPTDTLTSGTSIGDVYCNALGMTATLARERKGSGVDDRDQAVDEYADMARQVELDDFVNEWVEQHGAGNELSPGQGIVVGTAIFSMMVLVDDPELMAELQGEAEE